MGYWSEMKEDVPTFRKFTMVMDNALTERPLELYLDLYMPENDTLERHPLVMLIHGGSFYFGSRNDEAISKWCRHLASSDYVAASIDYREGFAPTKPDIERAGYRALQDAHAALRFLVANSEEYCIDTSMIVVGGCSAGAITALNLAYMTNETRPKSTFETASANDLGDIGSSGNDFDAPFSIKGIIDMWGALPDTCMMRGSKIPILAFHGDRDDIVPYGYGYPFEKIGVFNKLLSDKMYGSFCIVEAAQRQGQEAYLHTLLGWGHAPHRDPKTKELNENFLIIQEYMTSFLLQIIMDKKDPE